MWSSSRIDLMLLGLILLCLLDFTIARSEKRNPVSYITKVENPVIKTPSHRAHAHSSFDVIFTLHGGLQDVKFTLEPNDDIIPPGAVVEYLDENGQVEKREELVRRDYKIYKGNSWLRDDKGWRYAGWARIMITRDGVDPMFEGAFTLDHNAHHIHSRSNFLSTRHELDPIIEEGGEDFMVVWRDSDIQRKLRTQGLELRSDFGNVMCPSDRLSFNTQPGNPINKMIMEKEQGLWGRLGLEDLLGGGRIGLQRRQLDGSNILGGSGNSAGVSLKTTIGSTDGCPKTRLVALMGVATDCTYTGIFPTEADARSNIIRQLNIASDVYEQTFNVTLGLSQLVISKANCPGSAPEGSKWNVPCSETVTIENRLNLFSEWRGQRANDSLALWMLMTKCSTGSSVGLAWLGQLCQGAATKNSQDGSYVSGANVIARTDTEWKVMAHEIGHTMGAVHDCTTQTCTDGSASASLCCPYSSTVCDPNTLGKQFIMNPSTSDSIQSFSACTVGNICSAFKRKSVNTSCLSTNRGVSIITEQECGNGIVEEGEDCDCGGEAACLNNACCDAKTCKFKNNAVCDDSNEGCCTGCQFASANTVCRPSNGDCDPEEKCSGTSSSCPADVVSKDGTNCGNGLKCASGQCTSRDQQCQTVMGRLSSNNDTRSCDDNNCILTCQSPDLGAGMCVRMQQNFLDGTPCRGDGVCQNGNCSGASGFGVVKGWIDKHRNVAIGVGAGAGALVLFLMLCCCWGRCCQRRRPKNVAPFIPQQRGNRWEQRAGPYVQPPPMAQRRSGQHGRHGRHEGQFGHPRRGGSEAAVASHGYQPPVSHVRYA